MIPTVALVATLVLDAFWTPPAPPAAKPREPTALERSFGAGENNVVTLEARYYCTLQVSDDDGWTTCLHYSGSGPDPLMAKIVDAEERTPIGGCIAAVRLRRGGIKCFAFKTTSDALAR